ncbi:MAG TPA: ECF-type sigma factor [Gemmataceae bacterium]|nr:ECF-type sigma factor [Gemmataceae bacterium]
MADATSFTDLLRRVRGGEQSAAAELVRRYEPEIRTEVRLWLRRRHPHLRRTFDSMDICQAVLASFFLRAAAGQYDLEQPDQLLRLLVVMARHKLSEQVKYQQSQRRDVRRLAQVSPEHETAAIGQASPSEVVAGQELFHELRKRLSEDERRLADLRAEGQDWAAVASHMGGTPEGCRKKLARALDRVSRELGLTDVGAE